MRYFAYSLFILSAVLGYLALYPMIVLPLAFATSLIFAAARRKWLKANPPAIPVNPLVDGIYMFFLHMLIHFAAFAAGFFINYSVGFQ